MNSTSSSLLERLRQPHADEAWDRFVRLYTPLLFHWARGVGLREPDAAELVQDVLALLVRKMPEFHYDRRRSFRAWLRTVALNKWRERRRRESPASAGADALREVAAPDDMAAFEEAEYRRSVVRQALELVRPGFPDRTWQAFWRCAVQGEDPAAAARALGLRVGSVYAAKSHVLARLREELEGLLD
jgi:RNA polymerase sigma-70 factor (ECF subfamily)